MAKILIVEDDQLYGQDVAGALSDVGFEVFWAHNMKEAWQALEAQEINLVFLDIGLEGNNDGFEILYGIRQSERYRHIKVVMLSRLSQTSDLDRAMSMGADDYLVKANVDYARIVEIAKNLTASLN